jgi:hypothetical protein
LFNACNKDVKILDQGINPRSELRNISAEIQEFYKAFYFTKNTIEVNKECYLNPFYYDLILESGHITKYNGQKAYLFKVRESPFQYTKWDRNQILITKKNSGTFEVRNLVYLADSTFYADKTYRPLLINFTGIVIEINQENAFQNAYSLYLGQTFNKIDKIEFDRYLNTSNNLNLRDDDDIFEQDWGWGDGGGGCPPANKSHFWRDLKRWFQNKFKNINGNNSGNNGSNTNTNNPYKGGYYGGGFPTVIYEGTGGGGDNEDTQIYNLCEDLGNFWGKLKPTTKETYLEALSNIITELNVGICDDSYTNPENCPITYDEVLCNSLYFNCFDENGSLEISIEQFEDCLRDLLNPYRNTDIPYECLLAVETFNLSFGLNIDPFGLNIMMGGFGALCANQQAFTSAAMTAYLVENINLTNEQKAWLNISSNYSIKYKIFLYQIHQAYPNEALNYFIWAIMNHGHDLDFYTNGYDEFTKNEEYNLQNNSSISIINQFVPNFSPTGLQKICQTPLRPGHEYNPPDIMPYDLIADYNGDCRLLSKIPNRISLCDESDFKLLNNFNNLIHNSILNSDLQQVASEYFNHWISGNGSDFNNNYLCNYIITNKHMISTIHDFGKYLNDELKLVNGNLNFVNWNDFSERYRPIFRDGENSTGLRILINDTETMLVYSLGDYTYDVSTKQWSGSFYFQTFDNFGLDNEDLLKFQMHPLFGQGFASWWILQHKWGYHPFRTELRSVFKIKGNLNN